MDRRLGWAAIVAITAPLGLSGCSIAPKSFRDVVNTAPLTRARAVGLGDELPDEVAIPALIGRLSDPDPVVRLSAIEALKKRTKQDFGYIPWAEPADRAPAVRRWQAWWASQQPKAPQASTTRRSARRRLAATSRSAADG